VFWTGVSLVQENCLTFPSNMWPYPKTWTWSSSKSVPVFCDSVQMPTRTACHFTLSRMESRCQIFVRVIELKLPVHVIHACEGCRLELHLILSSVLIGNLRPRHFTPGERIAITEWVGCFVGFRAGLDVLQKSKIFGSCRESNQDQSVI